jgi:hypothetical protein
MDYFFDRPTQIAFYNVEDKCYDAGIADGDRIICLCCGGIIPIQELLDEVEEVAPEIKKPIIELSWCNLREECLGDVGFDSETGEIIHF